LILSIYYLLLLIINKLLTMSLSLLLLLLCIMIVSIVCQDEFIAPWYYHGLDGPKFTNKTIDGIETRYYYPAYWASTNIDGNDIISATSTGFNRLFDYISGANSKSVKIDMTTPVLTKVLLLFLLF